MREAGQRIGIFGRSGSGKSTLARDMMKGWDRVVVFDPLAEYQGRGVRVCQSLSDVIKTLKSVWKQKRFTVVYRPPVGAEGEALHHLSEVVRTAQMTGGRGRVLLLAEELNTGFPVHGLKAEMSGFANLCSRGRHYNVDLIGVSQRPAEVATRFRGNLTDWYIFSLADATDRQTVLRVIGRERGPDVGALSAHEYIRFDFQGNEFSTGKNRLRKKV